MNKVWKERRIYTASEQIVVIQPDEAMAELVLSINETRSKDETRLYLTPQEAKELANELLSYVSDNYK